MDYPDKTFSLPGGQRVSLRRPMAEDAQPLLDWLRRVSGETDFLGKGPEEITLTAEEERVFLQKTAADPAS